MFFLRVFKSTVILVEYMFFSMHKCKYYLIELVEPFRLNVLFSRNKHGLFIENLGH